MRIKTDVSASKRKSTQLASVVLAVLVLTTAAPAALGQKACNTNERRPVMPLNGSTVSGHGTLIVNGDSLDVLLGVHNLTPGGAYTTWFIYFDDTAQCLVPHQCGGPDLTMPVNNPAAVLARLDSAVAGENGRLTFRGSFRDFRVSPESAVHVAVFTHGPADNTDNRERARQLLTPEAPGLGAPGLGVEPKGSPVAGVVFDIGSRNCK